MMMSQVQVSQQIQRKLQSVVNSPQTLRRPTTTGVSNTILQQQKQLYNQNNQDKEIKISTTNQQWEQSTAQDQFNQSMIQFNNQQLQQQIQQQQHVHHKKRYSQDSNPFQRPSSSMSMPLSPNFANNQITYVREANHSKTNIGFYKPQNTSSLYYLQNDQKVGQANHLKPEDHRKVYMENSYTLKKNNYFNSSTNSARSNSFNNKFQIQQKRLHYVPVVKIKEQIQRQYQTNTQNKTQWSIYQEIKQQELENRLNQTAFDSKQESIGCFYLSGRKINAKRELSVGLKI